MAGAAVALQLTRAVKTARSGRLPTGYLTVSATAVVCVLPPPVPVMVMVLVPTLADRLTDTVMVDVPEPDAAMGLGLKLTLWPLLSPEADKLTAEAKPFSATLVIVAAPEWPLATLIAVGDALMVKSAVDPVTVRVTVVVCVTPPPVPVTTIG